MHQHKLNILLQFSIQFEFKVKLYNMMYSISLSLYDNPNYDNRYFEERNSLKVFAGFKFGVISLSQNKPKREHFRLSFSPKRRFCTTKVHYLSLALFYHILPHFRAPTPRTQLSRLVCSAVENSLETTAMPRARACLHFYLSHVCACRPQHIRDEVCSAILWI
jgi:hypothetical protein